MDFNVSSLLYNMFDIFFNKVVAMKCDYRKYFVLTVVAHVQWLFNKFQQHFVLLWHMQSSGRNSSFLSPAYN